MDTLHGDLYTFMIIYCLGHAVAQLVEVLCFMLEGHWFDFRWCHWNFSLTYSFRLHYSPRVDSASNRHEHQECFVRSKGSQCKGLTTLHPSCADCLKIWEPQPPETLGASQGLYRDWYTFINLKCVSFEILMPVPLNVHFFAMLCCDISKLS